MNIRMMPADFEMSIADCPPGHFLFKGKHVGFKSEYLTNSGNLEVFNEAGEAFWGGTSVAEERDKIMVIPLIVEIEL